MKTGSETVLVTTSEEPGIKAEIKCCIHLLRLEECELLLRFEYKFVHI